MWNAKISLAIATSERYIILKAAWTLERLTHTETKISAYLKIICFIVVHVQGPVQLTVSGYRQLLSARDPVVDGLPSILLHLNVVKLTEIAKPLDELRGNASVELLNLNSKKDKSTDIPPPQPHFFQKAFFPPLPHHLLNPHLCAWTAGGGWGKQLANNVSVSDEGKMYRDQKFQDK